MIQILTRVSTKYRRLCLACLFIVALASAGAACAQSSKASFLVIRNIGIVGSTKAAISVGTVEVRNGRITYVGPPTGTPPPPDARVIDGTGRSLVPALIDLHTHVSKTRRSSLGLLVAHGVTTVCDMGGDHEELLRWRQEIVSGQLLGPRLLIAGPYFESARNAARQHHTPPQEMVEPVERTQIGLATAVDADRIIVQLAARGVDHLKIRTVEDRATYLAIGAADRIPPDGLR